MSYYDEFRYPDANEQPIPGFSTSVQEAIGGVVIWFQELDGQLSTAIAFLLRRGDIVGQIVEANLSFAAKVNLLEALFKHERSDSQYFGHVHELSRACLQIEEKRNQVVHSKWSMQIEGSGMTRSKYNVKHKHGLQHYSEPLTPTQVESIGLHCGYLAHCVDELMYLEFGHEYGEP